MYSIFYSYLFLHKTLIIQTKCTPLDTKQMDILNIYIVKFLDILYTFELYYVYEIIIGGVLCRLI